jgi:hypothetical protein
MHLYSSTAPVYNVWQKQTPRLDTSAQVLSNFHALNRRTRVSA